MTTEAIFDRIPERIAHELQKTQLGLFIGWVKAEFVSTMFHGSHFIIKNVRKQFNHMVFPPCPKVHGFHANKENR